VPAQAFLWLAVGMMFGIRAKFAMAEKKLAMERKKAEAAARSVTRARGRN
jgi:hypothetical protein